MNLTARAWRLAVVLAAVSLASETAAAGPAANQKSRSRSAPRRTATPAPPANRPPEWPKEMQIETSSVNKYDEKKSGWLLGATTTIVVKTPATDPEGDPITYSWSGDGVGLTTAGPTPFQIKEGDLEGDGLTATWWRESWSGEPASGFIRITAKDGKGGEAVHMICLGRYVQCP